MWLSLMTFQAGYTSQVTLPCLRESLWIPSIPDTLFCPGAFAQIVLALSLTFSSLRIQLERHSPGDDRPGRPGEGCPHTLPWLQAPGSLLYVLVSLSP